MLKTQNRHYLEAFYELSSGRLMGEGAPQPVQTSEIFSYLDGFRIRDPQYREAFFARIKALDSEFLKHAREEAAKAMKV